MQEKIQRIEALLKEAYDIFDTLPQGNGSGFFAGLTVWCYTLVLMKN